MMKWESFISYLTAHILLTITIASYLFLEYTDDIKVFISAAIQAGYHGGFPYGVDFAYEIKPIGNRILFYIFNLIFGHIRSSLLEQVALKGIIAVAVLLICYYAATNLSCHVSLPRLLMFYILAIPVFTVSNFILMQPEWFSVIGCYLALAFVISDNRTLQIASGLVLAGVFTLKGVTGLMAIVVWCCVILVLQQGIRERIVRSIIGFISGVVIFVISVLTVFPFQMQDITSATMVSNMGNGATILVKLYAMLFGIYASLPEIPFLIIGGMLVVVITCRYASESKLKFAASVGALTSCFLFLYLLSEFYSYQWFVFVFPVSILSVLALERISIKDALIVMVAGMLATTGVYVYYDSSLSHDYSLQKETWNEYYRQADIVDSQLNISGQPEILYLDWGDATWFFGTKSACREIAPLSVMRDQKSIPQYKDTMACIKNYHGKYVISSDWWISYNSAVITVDNLTAKNYTKIYSGFWQIYQRTQTL